MSKKESADKDTSPKGTGEEADAAAQSDESSATESQDVDDNEGSGADSTDAPAPRDDSKATGSHDDGERRELPPTRRQLLVVAVIVVLTFLWWGGAKLACNYHPFQSHRPATLSVEDFSRDPKHAAIELQRRIAICDFEAALALSTGAAAEDVRRLRETASNDHCEERRRFAPRVLSYGELLTRDRETARARVHVKYGDGEETAVVELQRDRGTWKALNRSSE
jgi:hypothetical protein